ncbi:MAG: hypothetical protein J6A45_04910 [Lachnospiraceae bacterium]|nr:hypothetical protein [Lachnospiraceae bacterium]
MYHTEGYLDQNTYFAKGHIWSFQLAQGKSLCYFWCVLKEGVKENSDMFTQRLEKWVWQELAPFLEKGQLSIQRELKRLGEHLRAHQSIYGLQEVPRLHLYFQGKMYHYGTELEKMWSQHDEMAEDLEPEEVANRLKVDMLREQSMGHLEWGYFMMWEDDYGFWDRRVYKSGISL